MSKHYSVFYGLWRCYLCIVLLASPVLLSAQDKVYAHAQTAIPRPDLPVVQRSLREVLGEIQSRFQVSFVYESEVIEGKEIDGTVNYRSNVESMLSDLLNPVGLKFKKINRRTYSILPKSASIRRGNKMDTSRVGETLLNSATLESSRTSRILSPFAEQAQLEVVVKGKVTDDQQVPIPGANILLKGTSVGTSTDANGGYSITVPDANAVLIFSFIGYVSKEITVGSQTEINVALSTDMLQLSEVVVVGYGTQKKTSVTGAISSVTAKDIGVQPVANFAQALQGRVAGVTVTNNGAPGRAPVIQIRGVGTVNNSSPLYVIDGFPTSDLGAFNAKDFESIEVLKDASAAAIYGSRAANGVILITTKRGANRKLSVNLDVYEGVEQAWNKLDLLNTAQYVDYANDLLTNGGGAVPQRFVSGLDQPVYAGATQTFRQTQTDWQDEMFRTGAIRQYKVDLSGGNDKSRVYTSYGYFKQEGIMLGTGYKRGDARLNSDHDLSKRITIGQSFYMAYDETKAERGSNNGDRAQIMHMVRSAPYFPVYNPNNFGGFFGAQSVDGSDPENPVRIALQDQQNQQRLKLLANAYVDVKIFDFLTYRFQGGVDYVDFSQRTHLPSYNTAGYNNRAEAQLEQRRENFTSTILTNQLSFNKSFDKHTINATIVAEQQTSQFNQATGRGNNSISNDIKEPQALSAMSFVGDKREVALISYIGRVNYDFANKYLLGVSFRRDGSSRFADGKKWGNFPAVSVGWRLNEEGFLKDNTFVNELKIRGSYGLTGNNNIGDYRFQPTLSGNQIYQFDGTSSVHSIGYTVRRLANPNLKWESTQMTNVGIDLGLLNDKVTLTLEYFNNETKDMLLERPIAHSMGYDDRPTVNVGSVRNRGIEMQLGYNKTVGDLIFNASGNISVVRNKVLALGDEGTTFAGGEFYGDNLTLTEVGQPIGYFNGFITQGIFQTQEEVNAYVTSTGSLMQPDAKPGDIKFKDANGDGQLNATDKRNLGHFLPNFSYGANLSATFKGLDASVFLQGVQGSEIYSIVKYDLEGMTRLFNSGTAVLDRWTPSNRDTNVPRAVNSDPNKNARASDRFVEDGTYLRVKNLTVGYSLPRTVLTDIGGGYLTKARIYVTSQNLLTFTKYKNGFDPEIGNRTVDRNGNPVEGIGLNGTLVQGIDYGQYPQPRTFIVGLQVGF